LWLDRRQARSVGKLTTVAGSCHLSYQWEAWTGNNNGEEISTKNYGDQPRWRPSRRLAACLEVAALFHHYQPEIAS